MQTFNVSDGPVIPTSMNFFGYTLHRCFLVAEHWEGDSPQRPPPPLSITNPGLQQKHMLGLRH